MLVKVLNCIIVMPRLALFFNVLEEANRTDIRVRRKRRKISHYKSRQIEMHEESEEFEIKVKEVTSLKKNANEVSIHLSVYRCLGV